MKIKKGYMRFFFFSLICATSLFLTACDPAMSSTGLPSSGSEALETDDSRCIMPFSPPGRLPRIPGNLGIFVNRIERLPRDFMKGADISMLAQLEENGAIFHREDGTAADALEILRDHGVNWVRLRIWNNPVFPEGTTDYHGTAVSPGPVGGGNCDLETVTSLARRARQLGMRVYLAFHYSDFWADPGKQFAAG